MLERCDDEYDDDGNGFINFLSSICDGQRKRILKTHNTYTHFQEVNSESDDNTTTSRFFEYVPASAAVWTSCHTTDDDDADDDDVNVNAACALFKVAVIVVPFLTYIKNNNKMPQAFQQCNKRFTSKHIQTKISIYCSLLSFVFY